MYVFYRRQDAVTFEGDLTNDEAILNWLTSQEVFSIGDEIEEVNRKMLEKLLEENDFVAVYFCKLSYGEKVSNVLSHFCLSIVYYKNFQTQMIAKIIRTSLRD